jgi:hypothetical protein
MTFSSKAQQRRPAARCGLLALAAAALVTACGGGTSQFDPFIAQRVFSFGDDTSALTSDGRRYGVNGVNATTGAIDCNLEPLWVQSVASLYGFVFAECNTATPPATPKAFSFAAPGAKVADVALQVEAQVAAGGLKDKDLALVTAGTQDILELYAQYPAVGEQALIEQARGRGAAMAAVVNRLVDLNAKVIVANLPDLGLSPFARAEATANAASGVDRAALITRLTTAFNEQLGVRVLLACIERAGSVEGGLKFYVGAANLDDDSGYATKVLAEQERLKLVAEGKTVPTSGQTAWAVPELQPASAQMPDAPVSGGQRS